MKKNKDKIITFNQTDYAVIIGQRYHSMYFIYIIKWNYFNLTKDKMDLLKK